MQHLLEYFEQFCLKAGHSVTHLGNTTLIVTQTSGPEFNVIFASDTSDEKNTRAALEKANGMSIPFLFIQEKNPNDKLSALLNKQGFHYIGKATAVALDHATLTFSQNNTLPFTIRHVTNPSAFSQFSELATESFNMPSNDIEKVFAPAMPYLFEENSQYRAYLLYDESGVAISTALIYLPQDTTTPAGHYFWSTQADHRKKGAMTHLIKEMILLTKSLGYSHSVAQCYDTSLSLATALGFKAECELDLFCNVSA